MSVVWIHALTVEDELWALGTFLVTYNGYHSSLRQNKVLGTIKIPTII